MQIQDAVTFEVCATHSVHSMAAGEYHTILLRSDGNVAACGRNEDGQCDTPLLAGDVTYTGVSAGRSHTVLLQSDGNVVACG